MSFEFSERTKALRGRLRAFRDPHIYPNEKTFEREIEASRWAPTHIVEDLKKRTILD